MSVEVESVASTVTENSAREGVIAAAAGRAFTNPKKNQIHVSNKKKPLFFYVNLAKRYMQQYEEVELSALGMAIATVVAIAETLKNSGLAIEKRILTSSILMKDEYQGRTVQKAKIEIVLAKSEDFDALMIATTRDPEVATEEEN